MVAQRIFLLAAAILAAVHGTNASIKPTPTTGHWIDAWATMPQLTESSNLPPPPFNQTNLVFPNSTIRQTMHMTIGASQIRVRISNNFGIDNLPITAATIALPFNGSVGTSVIRPETLQTLTFSGSPSFSIPNGALVVSDPIDFPIKSQENIAITLYLADGQVSNDITSHPGSRTTSWFSFGNHVSATNLTDPSTQSIQHWYFLEAVEAWVPTTSRLFAIVGDSITDGRGSDTDSNNRWPDLLLANMQKNSQTADIAVANEAAGGNRILIDGLGPNALGRIDRDVISQSGVKYAMIFEGVNDIGETDTTDAAQDAVRDQIISAYIQIIRRVHTFGIPMFAATITPFGAPNNTIQPYSDPRREVTRQQVNAWIRDSGAFDAVIDFDKILADPKMPSQLNPLFNSGDFLHPNVLGYQTVANEFPLSIFEQFAAGVNGFD